MSGKPSTSYVAAHLIKKKKCGRLRKEDLGKEDINLTQTEKRKRDNRREKNLEAATRYRAKRKIRMEQQQNIIFIKLPKAADELQIALENTDCEPAKEGLTALYDIIRRLQDTVNLTDVLKRTSDSGASNCEEGANELSEREKASALWSQAPPSQGTYTGTSLPQAVGGGKVQETNAPPNHQVTDSSFDTVKVYEQSQSQLYDCTERSSVVGYRNTAERRGACANRFISMADESVMLSQPSSANNSYSLKLHFQHSSQMWRGANGIWQPSAEKFAEPVTADRFYWERPEGSASSEDNKVIASKDAENRFDGDRTFATLVPVTTAQPLNETAFANAPQNDICHSQEPNTESPMQHTEGPWAQNLEPHLNDDLDDIMSSPSLPHNRGVESSLPVNHSVQSVDDQRRDMDSDWLQNVCLNVAYPHSPPDCSAIDTLLKQQTEVLDWNLREMEMSDTMPSGP